MKLFFLFFLSAVTLVNAQSTDERTQSKFNQLSELNWEESFFDSFSEPWQTNWFLDGEKATLTQSSEGLDFYAGPDAWDDSSHAVLWTRQNFSGDLKIEFDYVRLDSAVKFVNIIYIQATGSGLEGFDKDIEKWKERRSVPAMREYFLNMNAYHISFAAFGTKNDDENLDYVRARRYMPSLKGLRGSELKPDYSETGLFKPHVPHKITIIKKDRELFMVVRNSDETALFHWKNEEFPAITEGRIGLRHMYTRGANYKNFRVWGLN